MPDRPPKGHTRVLSVPQAASPPVIDGYVDDATWSRRAQADGFWNSQQDRWPAEETEVIVASDRTHLYFAFKVFDSRPDQIEALQTRRDSDLGLDDQVAIVLDPFLTYREMSTYRVNAIGTQRDELGSGRARQISWKGDWKAAVQRTDFGWIAEIEIPFEILNFPPGTPTIGINFLRYHHRTGEWSNWADVTVRNLPEEMGRLTDLRPALVTKDKPLTFMPYVLAGRNVPNRRGEIKERMLDAGVDIRYEPRPNLTGVLSIRPDFSQVETSITDIDFNYNEKYRADPRLFFQEGSAYFNESRTYFYSNRIPGFDVGLKGFGRVDSNRFGVLAVRSPNDRTDAVINFNKQFDPTHNAGATIVSTDRQDLRNELYAVKGRGREASGLEYGIDAATTRTRPSARSGSFGNGTIGWGQGYWSVGASLDRYSRFFGPENGLLARDLPDTSGRTGYVSYYRDRAEGVLREVVGNLSFEERDTGDGRLQRRRSYAGGSVEFREQQIRIGSSYYAGPYRPVLAGPGEWAGTMFNDRFWNASLDFNTRSSRFGYGGAYSNGFLGGGDYRYFTAYTWLRPTHTTFLNLSTETLENFGTYRQTVLTGGWDITPIHAISGRFIDADYGRAYRLAYTWHPLTSLDLFLVWDVFPGQPRQLSIKMQMTQ